PKPLCECHICEEAREKGVPYERTGPSAFLHDENILIDTPAEIIHQLNRSRIRKIDTLLFTHLDPDHIEGMRVLEQISLDFRIWLAYPDKQIRLALPELLMIGLKEVRSRYGVLIDFYVRQGYVTCVPFKDRIHIGNTLITAIPVDRGDQYAFIYIFEKEGKRVVYAPCDIKPFPESRPEVRNADLLVIQPGIFEDSLKHGFIYPDDHISRTTLYTFGETLDLGRRIHAAEILFVHLEEYWNRGFDEYRKLESEFDHIRFSCDGMEVRI
ncbi:MBL fold metallo-hydrolase, partial [Thermodesulfobacteriota bacterium]